MEQRDQQGGQCKIQKEMLIIFPKTVRRSSGPCAFLVAQKVKNLPAMQETTCSTGDLGLIPGSGRSRGEGNDNPLQYSYLGNSMDRGAWQATVHGVARVGNDLATKPPNINS